MHFEEIIVLLLKPKTVSFNINLCIHDIILGSLLPDDSKNTLFRLRGNPLCSNDSLAQFCGSQGATDTDTDNGVPAISNATCQVQSCPPPYEYSETSPVKCFCAAPLLVEYRLKSPGLYQFPPYENAFEIYLTNGLELFIYQLYISNYVWEEGPRLRMNLKLYPIYDAQNTSSSHIFNRSEVLRLRSMFTAWLIPDSDIFGPYELIDFTLLGPYQDCKSQKVLMTSPARVLGGTWNFFFL